MNILVIPDVHERFRTARKIWENGADRADQVIWLGDFMDSFETTPESVHGAMHLVADALCDEKSIVLFGNHDCQYIWPVGMLRCSGFNRYTQGCVRKKFVDIKDKFLTDLWADRGKFFWSLPDKGILFSHAGLADRFKHYIDLPNLNRILLDSAAAGQDHPLLLAGHGRGGNKQYSGGLTWLDWNSEFKPVSGINQFVGHTEFVVRDGDPVYKAKVALNSINVCLDNQLKCGFLLDTESLGFEPIYPE